MQLVLRKEEKGSRTGSVFVLSGEDLTFPFSEIKALIQTYAPSETCETMGKRVVASSLSDSKIISRITSRAAYCRFGGQFVSQSEISGNPNSLIDSLDPRIIEEGRSYAVASETLERGEYTELGGAIKSLTGAKVSLENPDYLFQAEKNDSGGYILAYSLDGRKRFSWRERRPRARKFFLPSAIYPKLARLLVNLSRVREEQLFLDPFCGTGSLLIEAAIMGMKTAGIDLGRWVAKGALKNLKGFNLGDNSAIIRADSTGRLPLRKVDAVATDVPYGRAASTRGKDTSTIMREFTSCLSEHLTNDKSSVVPKYAVIMRPSHVDLELDRKSFEVEENHLLYVHRNLTRAITVLRRI